MAWRGDLCAGVPAEAASGVPAHLEEFLGVYEERFAKVHGPLRPVVERVLRAFMR
jgi:hypothetical protein